jgi:tetratricopeptide (TPR) repeat protein
MADADRPLAPNQESLRLHSARAAALHSQGLIEGRKGNWVRAAELLGQAVAANPNDVAALCDRGVALKQLQQWDAALASYEGAIARDPMHPEAHSNRGNVLRELKRWDAALASYDRALALRPTYAEAWYNRGVLLQDLHRLHDAVASYDRAIAVRPEYARAHCNRGVALENLHQFEAALSSYDRAIALDAGYTQAHANRGNVLRALNQLEASIAGCDAAIARDPGHALAYLNRGLARLLAGDLERGWPDFEWRWRVPGSPLMKDTRVLAQPLWLGQQSLAGRSILLHAEQGLGDTIQFCRYVEKVAALGAQVILEVPPPLERLLTGLAGVDRLILRGGALPDFDYHSPLMSLPLAFKTTLADIPAAVPYIHADPQKSRDWRQRLGEPRGLRVGLVWSGGFRPEQPEVWPVNDRRNIALAALAPLQNPRIEFFSLQKGRPAEAELASLITQNWPGPVLRDFTAELDDFSDTAALMMNMDLIISVDTSSAHLAGALGRPVWILNRFDTCWRWLLDRSDSPWYPTARLYRQRTAGDWEEVVQRVAADLVELADA